MSYAIDVAIGNIDTNFKRVLEFGVYTGGTIKKIRSLLPNKYQIFGFDSFCGLPEDWQGTSFKKCDFNLNNYIPNIDDVILIKGFFEETLPKFIQFYQQEPCALIHIDCDLYSSTKTIFKYITPSICKGTILLFDEWFYNGKGECNDAEQKAFYEWVLDNGINYSFIDLPDPIDFERKIVIIK